MVFLVAKVREVLEHTQQALGEGYTLDVVRFDTTGVRTSKRKEPFIQCIELNLAG